MTTEVEEMGGTVESTDQPTDLPRLEIGTMADIGQDLARQDTEATDIVVAAHDARQKTTFLCRAVSQETFQMYR